MMTEMEEFQQLAKEIEVVSSKTVLAASVIYVDHHYRRDGSQLLQPFMVFVLEVV